MAIANPDIARIFDELADLLEIQGANPFRVGAYRRAARVVEQQGEPLSEMVHRAADLTELEGIGDDLAGKIKEIVETGGLAALEKERRKIPPSLLHLLRVEGLGPKRAHRLYKELKIEDLGALQKAAEAGQVAELKGFGEKTQAKILESLRQVQAEERRFRIHDVTPVAEALRRHLATVEAVDAVWVAGSYRRRRETVGDIDLLVVAEEGAARVMDAFVGYADVAQVVSKGPTRSTVRLRNHLQVDLRVVASAAAGAALHYFTGSKAHNIAVRRRAQRAGLKLNEYGIFREEEQIGGRDETEIFAAVGLPYIEPELREGQGELEAAEEGRLPDLVTADHLRGDLHAHTDATDGRDPLAKMAQAAEALGHEYLAITDHTKRTSIANGMDADGFRMQAAAIDRLNEQLGKIQILKSAEVDILKDGTLDLPDDVLASFDIVVCSLHHPGDLDRSAQTERILRAMEHPCAHILGHPSGRIIGGRDAYDIDLERVFQAAADDGWAVELNAQPKRLDLPDRDARRAKEYGVKVAISSDAHSTDQLGNLRYGVDQARRAWLEKDDIVNTRTLRQLERLIAR